MLVCLLFWLVVDGTENKDFQNFEGGNTTLLIYDIFNIFKSDKMEDIFNNFFGDAACIIFPCSLYKPREVYHIVVVYMHLYAMCVKGMGTLSASIFHKRMGNHPKIIFSQMTHYF